MGLAVSRLSAHLDGRGAKCQIHIFSVHRRQNPLSPTLPPGRSVRKKPLPRPFWALTARISCAPRPEPAPSVPRRTPLQAPHFSGPRKTPLQNRLVPPAFSIVPSYKSHTHPLIFHHPPHISLIFPSAKKGADATFFKESGNIACRTFCFYEMDRIFKHHRHRVYDRMQCRDLRTANGR